MARVAIPLEKGLNAEEGLSDHKTCLEELVSLHLIDVSDFAGTYRGYSIVVIDEDGKTIASVPITPD